MSALVEHAKRELELCGQTAEDPEFAASIIRAVEGFASYPGHSGGSAMAARDMLHRLLNFQCLSEITADPAEWHEPGPGMWQSRRDPAIFSRDGGATFYHVDHPELSRRSAPARV